MAVYYVDASATGIGSGASWADAYTTIAAAAAKATVGDRVNVRGGGSNVYRENLAPGGGRSATWYAVSGDVIIDGYTLGSVSGVVPGNGANLTFDGDPGTRWIVRGFKTSSRQGIITTGTTSLTIQNVPFYVFDCDGGARLTGIGTYDIHRLFISHTAAIGLTLDSTGVCTYNFYHSVVEDCSRVEVSATNASTVANFWNCALLGLHLYGMRLTAAFAGTVFWRNGVAAGCPDPIQTTFPFTNQTGRQSALQIGNSLTLVKPNDKTTYGVGNSDMVKVSGSATGFTDLGGNVYHEPVFASGLRNGAITIGIDDASNYANFQALYQRADLYGLKVTWCVDTANMVPAAWAVARAALANGHAVISHTRRHANMSTLNGFGIKYKGAGSACALTISGGVLTTVCTGDAPSNLNLTLSSYANVGALVTAIVAGFGAAYDVICYDLTGSVVGNSATNFGVQTGNTDTRTYTANPTPTTLADVASIDVKTAQVTLLHDRTKYFQEEINGSFADIYANTGVRTTLMVTPGNWGNYFTDNTYWPDWQANGVTYCRNGPNSSTGVSYFIGNVTAMSTEGFNLSNSFPITLTTAEMRQAVMAAFEWVKTSGAEIYFFTHGIGGTNFSAAQLQQFVDWAAESGVRCVSYETMAAILNAGMNYNDLTWVPAYYSPLYKGSRKGQPSGLVGAAAIDFLGAPLNLRQTIGPIEQGGLVGRPAVSRRAVTRAAVSGARRAATRG